MLSKNILYYPNIEFFDETWVKSSLCIWEKIFRIAPTSYSLKDSDEIKEAIDAGLIENILIIFNSIIPLKRILGIFT